MSLPALIEREEMELDPSSLLQSPALHCQAHLNKLSKRSKLSFIPPRPQPFLSKIKTVADQKPLKRGKLPASHFFADTLLF